MPSGLKNLEREGEKIKKMLVSYVKILKGTIIEIKPSKIQPKFCLVFLLLLLFFFSSASTFSSPS